MKYILIIIIVLMFNGCFAPRVLPVKKDIANKKSFQLEYDKVWSKIIECFAAANMPLKTIDKASGIIYSESAILFPDKYADCGSGGYPGWKRTVKGEFNIVVSQEQPVKVTVNLTCVIMFSLPKTKSVFEACYSTGVFENELFDYIEK